jgi:hypothetical protein
MLCFPDLRLFESLSLSVNRDLTIVCRIDLNDSGADGEGGMVPMWIYVKTIGHTAAASIHKMRQALLSDHDSDAC